MSQSEIPDVPARTLVSPDGRLSATFLPSLNMLCSSLVHDGEELLHLRAGISAYADHGKTCGIPFLHPWANRLSGVRYVAAGRTVVLTERARKITRDANGLPNHGLLGGRTAWETGAPSTTNGAATLQARLSFTSEDLLANFPYPHELAMVASVGDGVLTIAVTLTPTSQQAVPVSFGFHPYLCLPGVEREKWIVSLPVRRHLVLDERSIPTGASESVRIERAALGARTYDDAFTGIEAPRVFAMEGGKRRIEVEFGESYPYAQVFAPPGSDFLCIEPMTAPANALVTGGAALRLVEPGASFEAVFRLRIAR
jgi:galactose mutarotase-like enzyme